MKHLGDRPAEFSRRVLLAVSGLSPQVVTETLFALAVLPPVAERFVPTEIVVLTTAEGARRARQSLLSASKGAFHALRADHGLPAIHFDDASVRVVTDVQGQPLDDIRSDADNAAMADAITRLVAELTADPECALHVSLAGGRKTMGYYAGYALSLLGRVQDRLSHVLVSAPFESSPDFFYPTPGPCVISVAGGQERADAAAAQVSLAHIPFVRLRELLPAELRAGASSFAMSVAAAERRLAPPRMVVETHRPRIEADGVSLDLTPWQWALMAALAQRARSGAPPLAPPAQKDGHDAAWASAVLADLENALGRWNLPESVAGTLRLAACGNTVSPHWSRLRKRLNEALGRQRALLYFQDGGTPRHKRYCVPLAAHAIEIRRGAHAASLPTPPQPPARPHTA